MSLSRAIMATMARGRRSRIPTILFVFLLVLLLWVWRDLDEKPAFSLSRPRYRSSLDLNLPFASLFAGQDSTASTSGALHLNSTPGNRPRQGPFFHVLIPASEANGRLCKSVLSTHLLNFPSPTLINFGKVFDGEGWDKGSHTGKIQGVHEFLSRETDFHDDDLVLIIDGYDVWFQLPPEVLVRRYHAMIEEANQKLRREYGTVVRETPWKISGTETVQRYKQTVVFGADKLCWPNDTDAPACASLPESTLRKDIYGPQTDKDPEGFANRPRYLNSGTVIGPVGDVRAIYRRASEKVEEGRGILGDQFVFAEIFGEQEQQRTAVKASSKADSSKWLLHLSGMQSTNSLTDYIPTPAQDATRNSESHYEFSIGLDYHSSLFQTVTHSVNDIEFIDFSNTTALLNAQSLHQISKPQPLTFPPDLEQARARPPYPTNNTFTDLAVSTLLPISPDYDFLPENTTWYNTTLATNVYTRQISALLHINGDKFSLDTWWSSMWFQPHARAQLRHYMRSPQPFIWGTGTGEEKTWDMRGGRGGVWMTNGRWMEWGELCKGFEEEVFGDGKGEWGKEEGDGRTFNYWGQQITGDVVSARSAQRDIES